ncbi:uncharacterized protein LOC121986953 [Zingiber officinale]|uniref:uncharacterized protein LOC121986953 n=1 Tax=Zingiber officinale TaxID=94328 RepID=UPI001C4D8A4D|nr:uncharacterized protein LOC121986953 [Zingiber officinale]
MNENAPGNNQMKSPTVQKDLTRACVAEVTNFILNDIKDNIFSLMVDECRDISVKEQIRVVLRYVNKHGCVIEIFLAIVYVSDTSAISLKKAIDELFAKHKLSLSRLRGQGYDGASNMRVAKSNRIVSDLFQYVTMIVNVTVLENVYDDGTNDDNNGIAASLIDKMESYEFEFVMHLMKSLLGTTNELPLALQQKDQNIVLDTMVQEMNNRFSESSTELLRLAELYPEDFALIDRVILEDQLETYIQNVRVATASVERVFSVIKIIKTNLRNRMGDEWMNDSFVVYIEKDIFATIENEQILQHFQQMNTRRIQLPPLQGPRKTLRAYIHRFNQAAMEIPTVSSETMILAFTQGPIDGDFFRSLIRKPPHDYDHMLKKTSEYINVEEA